MGDGPATRVVGVEWAERGSQIAIRLHGGGRALPNAADGSEKVRTGFDHWIWQSRGHDDLETSFQRRGMLNEGESTENKGVGTENCRCEPAQLFHGVGLK